MQLLLREKLLNRTFLLPALGLFWMMLSFSIRWECRSPPRVATRATAHFGMLKFPGWSAPHSEPYSNISIKNT